MSNGNGNGWLRYWPVITALLGLFAGGVVVNERVRKLDQVVESKASRQEVLQQYQSILRELDDIKGRLDRRGAR